MAEDDTTTSRLRAVQDGRAQDAAKLARTADDEPEARTHARRAEKAAYLRDRLAEAERAEREAGAEDAG
jgi:hypothetical protein